MLIDVDGNSVELFVRGEGLVIEDNDNPYNMEFAIAVRYTPKQKQAFHEICECKRYLKKTDYKAIKYAEGALTEEEYAPVKEARAQARAHINEIAFVEPTLTRAEMDEAERKAMEKIKEAQDADN
jgi:hypothetical protein